MHLIQVFIPIYDPSGKRFPGNWFADIKAALTERFGGLTIYQRAPATGFWKEEPGHTSKDEIIIYEVIAPQVDLSFWKEYKCSLEVQFNQKELMVRTSEIQVIT